MSWKDLFIINNGEEVKKETVEVDSSNQQVNPSVTTNSVTITPPIVAVPSAGVPLENHPNCQPHMEKILQMYETGFEGLNMEGYDFFELYKAILSAGPDNPSVYPMAFTMAQTMDKRITKDSLVSQSDFYVQEITKVYTNYVNNGTAKKNDLLSKKETEKQQLASEIQNIKMQIEALSNQMNNAQNNLSQIDNKYAEDLLEVDCKLMANDLAKNNLLASINKVKQGLINNVK